MTLLKSINITSDLLHPERVAHYRPTSKSIEIIHAVAGFDRNRATSVIASYGTGKSIAATVAALFVEADPAKIKMIPEVMKRLETLDADFVRTINTRIQTSDCGLVVTLSGYIADIPDTLSRAIGKPGASSLREALNEIETAMRRNGVDRLAIVWDEFGRHLEHLVTTSAAEKLAVVQDLAEWIARRKRPSATLTLLLHQDFQQYAGRLGQSEQSAWHKIEGRFDALRILEDSDEIFQFVAEVAEEIRSNDQRIKIRTDTLRAVGDLGIFPFLPEGAPLNELLMRAMPIMPAVLYLLPRIAGRIGQGERTILGFLNDTIPSVEDGGQVTIEELYAYFSIAMRADTAPGGTHRRYVEVESARSRCQDPVEREIIAAAALAQLGGATERTRIGKSDLSSFMIAGSKHSPAVINAGIDALLARKLLLHRQLTDDISVWHGADIDLRSLVADTAETLRAKGDILSRIGELVRAPCYVAPRYNYTTAMIRYAQGVFITLAEIKSVEGLKRLSTLSTRHDALVAIVVDAALTDLEAIDQTFFSTHPHIILALSRERPDLDQLCLDVAALQELAEDEVLLETDPLVEREIQELLANALDYLYSRAQMLLEPEAGSVLWLAGTTRHGAETGFSPGEVLNDVFRTRFPLTPRIANEQIVRRRVTPAMKSARKRLILGILERSLVPDLGYKNATSADASLFRTILVRSGLYEPQAGIWNPPSKVKDLDVGLSMAWNEICTFYSKPAKRPKLFTGLLSTLTSPPYGIRQGLLPILLAAGLRAFGTSLAIRQNVGGKWVFVDDVQPSTIEDIASQPEAFEIEVIALTNKKKTVLKDIIAEFSPTRDEVETDLIRAFFDAFTAWQRNLPRAAMKSRDLGAEASELQRLIRVTDMDPIDLLFRAIPEVAGAEPIDTKSRNYLSRARQQMECMTERYVAQAIEIANEAFSAGYTSKTDTLLNSATRWVGDIPTSILKDKALDAVAKGVLNRSRNLDLSRDTEASFARALSAMLVGLDFEEWDDIIARKFARELRSRIREVEDILVACHGADVDASLFIARRIITHMAKLNETIGREETTKLLNSIEKTHS